MYYIKVVSWVIHVTEEAKWVKCIYVQSWKKCALPFITAMVQWYCDKSCTWAHDVYIQLVWSGDLPSSTFF